MTCGGQEYSGEKRQGDGGGGVLVFLQGRIESHLVVYVHLHV